MASILTAEEEEFTFDECHEGEARARREEQRAVARGDHTGAGFHNARRRAYLDRAQRILQDEAKARVLAAATREADDVMERIGSLTFRRVGEIAAKKFDSVEVLKRVREELEAGNEGHALKLTEDFLHEIGEL